MIDLETIDFRDFMSQMISKSDCPLCDSKTEVTFKKLKTKLILTRKHFCTTANGHCKVTTEHFFKQGKH